MLISIRISSQSLPQNYELGYYYDISNHKIDGYYDKEYYPLSSIKKETVVGKFLTPGYYYDLKMNKINGLIKYSGFNNAIYFRTFSDTLVKIITPNECSGFVMGLDTFTVINNLNDGDEPSLSNSNSREFVQFIDKIGKLSFYRLIRAFHNKHVNTFYVKADSSNIFLNFPKGLYKLQEFEMQVFGEFESLKTNIDAGIYVYNDIPKLIRLYKYKYKYDTHEKIFFNSSWDEIENENKSTYYALVDSLKDSIFHLKYFSINNIPIYEGNYTSLNPIRRIGEFIWYYPNGNPRKKTNYINNISQEITAFYPNNKIHYIYKIIKDFPYYTMVLSKEGKSVIDDKGNGTELFYDSIVGRQLTNEFKKNKLINSYFIDSNNRKIYQVCDNNAILIDLHLAQLQKPFQIKTENDFKHGIVYIKCIIDQKGSASDFQVINSINPEQENAVIDFLSYPDIINAWIPAKVNKEKVAQEILIPLILSINNLYKI